MCCELSFLLPLIFFTLRVISSAIPSPAVCQSGEVGIGLIVDNDGITNGAIYTSSCELLDKSSESTWYEGGWSVGTRVSSGVGVDGYSGPSGVLVDGRIYKSCYSLSQTSSCLLRDQKDKIPDHAIVPYCCESAAGDNDDDNDISSAAKEFLKDQGGFDDE